MFVVFLFNAVVHCLRLVVGCLLFDVARCCSVVRFFLFFVFCVCVVCCCLWLHMFVARSLLPTVCLLFVVWLALCVVRLLLPVVVSCLSCVVCCCGLWCAVCGRWLLVVCCLL